MDDPTKLTSFKPLTPAPGSSGFSFSKWFDGFSRRKTSQAPKLPSTEEQGHGKSSVDPKERKISQSVASQANDKNDKKENTERVSFSKFLYKNLI